MRRWRRSISLALSVGQHYKEPDLNIHTGLLNMRPGAILVVRVSFCQEGNSTRRMGFQYILRGLFAPLK